MTTATEMIEQKDETLAKLKAQIDVMYIRLRAEHQEAGRARLALQEDQGRKNRQVLIERFQSIQDAQEKSVLDLEEKEKATTAELRSLVETHNLLGGENHRNDAWVSWREKVVITDHKGLVRFLDNANRDDLLRVKKELDKRKFDKVAREIHAELPENNFFYIDNVSSFTLKGLADD